MSGPLRAEKILQSTDSGPSVEREERFSPLQTLPRDAPEAKRRRWERLAAKADHQYRAAVELKCLECCAWYRTEAARCTLTGCPLWALNRRIFARRA